jgi:hypothetical protein
MSRDPGAVRRPDSNPADYRTPDTVEDLTKRNVETVVRLEEAAKANRDTTDRMADLINRFCGSFRFVWVHPPRLSQTPWAMLTRGVRNSRSSSHSIAVF